MGSQSTAKIDIYSFIFTFRSHVDKQHMNFVDSLPLNAGQGNHIAAPAGRGLRNIAQGSHTGMDPGFSKRGGVEIVK